MTVATGISPTSLVGLLATNPELVATVVAMRNARKTWQQIATATKRHPATVRDIGLAKGLSLCLPGSHAYGGKRADWDRKRIEKARKPSAREPLPAGHPITWRAISVAPWPGVITL